MDPPRRRLQIVTPPQDPFGEQETDDFQEAWDRGFYMTLERRKDNDHVERMLYGGNNLTKALEAFDAIVRKRPGGYWTVQQRARVLRKWPED